MKKGAMFGLDARIALAIFGSLSVISGASLYSAIKESKSVSFYTQITEIEKAIEALYLDVGYLPYEDNTTYTVPYVSYLYENKPATLSTWNGPYIARPDSSHSSTTEMLFRDMFVEITSKKPFGCTGTQGSAENWYIRVKSIEGTSDLTCDIDLTFAKEIHDKYDSDGDYNSGQIMVSSTNAVDATKAMIAFKLPDSLY